MEDSTKFYKKYNIEFESNKQLLSTSVVKKKSNFNPEKILFDELYPKYGDRYIEYRKKYENYLIDKKHKFLPEYPISVILELVNRCNLECTMCFQGYRNDSAKSVLDEKTLEKLFQEFKNNKLEALLLSSSEPLLYKNFDKILKLAENSKIMDIFLFTNGTLLNNKNSELIINSSLTRLFVSIDAATEATYDKVRIPVNKKILNTQRLEKIESNIKNFINLRNSFNKKLPLVRVSFVALETNVHEVDMFVNKWINIVDTVEIQKENSIKIYNDLLNDKSDVKSIANGKIYNCNEPWGQVTIHSDGTVGPCCNTVGRNLPVGNIKYNSLKEIWHNKIISEIREGFVNNKPNKICKLCLDYEKINL
jgi:radical SAM protein with 4Fe4S-binding SPASM domain